MRWQGIFLTAWALLLTAPVQSQTYFQKFDPNEDARLATPLTSVFKAVFSGNAKAFAQSIVPGTTIYWDDNTIGPDGLNRPLTLSLMKHYVVDCEYLLADYPDFPRVVEVDWKCPTEPNGREYFRFIVVGKVAWAYRGIRPRPVIHVEK